MAHSIFLWIFDRTPNDLKTEVIPNGRIQTDLKDFLLTPRFIIIKMLITS